MPNDAKLGLLVGMAAVVLIATIFFRKDPAQAQPPTPAPAPSQTTAPDLPSVPPLPASVPVLPPVSNPPADHEIPVLPPPPMLSGRPTSSSPCHA